MTDLEKRAAIRMQVESARYAESARSDAYWFPSDDGWYFRAHARIRQETSAAWARAARRLMGIE